MRDSWFTSCSPVNTNAFIWLSGSGSGDVGPMPGMPNWNALWARATWPRKRLHERLHSAHKGLSSRLKRDSHSQCVSLIRWHLFVIRLKMESNRMASRLENSIRLYWTRLEIASRELLLEFSFGERRRGWKHLESFLGRLEDLLAVLKDPTAEPSN